MRTSFSQNKSIYKRQLNLFYFCHQLYCSIFKCTTLIILVHLLKQTMQGGLFGLSDKQKTYLYLAQLVPALIVLFGSDLVTIFAYIQIFYLISSFFYIKFMSLQKQLYPYVFYEFSKKEYQIQKGYGLAISAYLLITVYGILILKIGKIVLPHEINLGAITVEHWSPIIMVCLINPLLEEWFWRLFQPKTLQSTYYKNWVINLTYLVFHFILFSKYLGFWRALPFVTSFFSVGRSMGHIKQKYGIISAILTHYGITLAGFSLFAYITIFTNIKID